MNIRWKTSIIVSLVALCLLPILYYAANSIMTSNVASAEKGDIQTDTQRFLNSLSYEFSTLNSTVNDWAAWDDTYAFVENNNTNYINSNLMDSTFTTLNLNVMLFVNSQGKLVFGKAFDLINQTEAPVPFDLIQHCNLNDLLLSSGNVKDGLTGLILLSEEPLLVASHTILTSLSEGPPHGTLIIGRYFYEVQPYLEEVIGLKLESCAVNNFAMPSDFQTANASLTAGSPLVIKPLNETLISGYTLLKDIYGSPALIVKITDVRQSYAQGQAALFYFLPSLVIGAIMLVAMDAVLLDKFVLRRLTKLGKDVTNITTGGDSNDRVSVKGNDELSVLAEKINGMLAAMSQSRKQLNEYAEKLEDKVQERTRSLKQSREKLRGIFAASPDAITATDLSGKIVECNKQTCQLHGYSRKELLGKSGLELIDARDHKKAIENMRETLKHKTECVELCSVRKDGSIFPAELSASVLLSPSGKPIGFVVITKDITKRKQMEQELAKSERFATIGELAGMIGHDLRNPLTGIVGASYYLRNKCKSKFDAKELSMIDTIDECVEYSNKIINDLLDYSRDIRLELSETSPKSMLKEAFLLLKPPVNVELIDKTDEKTVLKVDSGKMLRVFMNVMKNSFEAMPKGGKLVVESHEHHERVVISFSDTGIGMSKKLINKVWTPLLTTKAKGMGFGLPICKRIVEAHSGSISINSIQGKGTTVTIILPVNPVIKTDEEIWVNLPESIFEKQKSSLS